jgi:hypothetical protein
MAADGNWKSALAYAAQQDELTLSRVKSPRPTVHAPINLFVAAPMSAYADNAEFKNNRSRLVEFISGLRGSGKFDKIFCPAVELDDIDKFDQNEYAFAADLLALEQSDAFVLYYMPPLPVRPSSVLVEAGMAIALRLPSLFVVKRRGDLPYILKDADKVALSNVASHKPAARERLPDAMVSRLPDEPYVKIVETDADDAAPVDEALSWFEQTHAKGSPR